MDKTFCDRHPGKEGRRYGVLGERYCDAAGDMDDRYEPADLCEDCISYVEKNIKTLPLEERIPAFKKYLGRWYANLER